MNELQVYKPNKNMTHTQDKYNLFTPFIFFFIQSNLALQI